MWNSSYSLFTFHSTHFLFDFSLPKLFSTKTQIVVTRTIQPLSTKENRIIQRKHKLGTNQEQKDLEGNDVEVTLSTV